MRFNFPHVSGSCSLFFMLPLKMATYLHRASPFHLPFTVQLPFLTSFPQDTGKVERKGARRWRALSSWESRGKRQEQADHAREQQSGEKRGLLLPVPRRLRMQLGGLFLPAVHSPAAKHFQKRRRLNMPYCRGITSLTLL